MKNQRPIYNSETLDIVVDLAQRAKQKGTFGVGGVLLGPDGTILHRVENRVLVNRSKNDPTMHAEMQLVRWHEAQVEAGNVLPTPEECTILSSLEPCIMCAGAMLAKGFRSIWLAPDVNSGVAYDGSFSSLPEECRRLAIQTFSPVGHVYDEVAQKFVANGRAYNKHVEKAAKTFGGSLPGVIQTIQKADKKQSFTFGEMTEDQREDMRSTVVQHGGIASDLISPHNRRNPKLFVEMGALGVDTEWANIAALLDSTGHVIAYAAPNAEGGSPDTGFMRLIRIHSALRKEHALQPFRECKVVTLYAPGHKPLDMMHMGAYVSATEGGSVNPQTGGWSYLFSGEQSQAQRQEMLQALPPLHRRVLTHAIQKARDVSCL